MPAPGKEKEMNINIRFESKPGEDIRATLKDHGFRWSPKFGTWWTSKGTPEILAEVADLEGVEVLDGRPEKSGKTSSDGAEIKFLWNGIKVDGVLFTGRWRVRMAGEGVGAIIFTANKGIICHYSTKRGIGYGAATNWATDLEERLHTVIHNNSDGMTDYFENDRLIFLPNNPHHSAAADAKKAMDIRSLKKNIDFCRKMYEKGGQIFYKEAESEAAAELAKLEAAQ